MRNLQIDFLKDREHFNAAMQYWEELCLNVLKEAGQEQQWKPWFSDHQKGQLPALEEGSIYSMYFPAEGKAVNIEQFLPKVGEPLISAHLDVFGEGLLNEPIEYLNISCVLSQESAGLAQRLLAKWVHPNCTTQEMESYIAEVLESK